MARRFITTVDSPLTDIGFPSFEERVAATDAKQTVKGMFFDDVMKVLDGDTTPYAAALLAPPRGGRYLPFSSYPLRDHAVLAYHASRKLHPGLSMREGVRRMHRGNIEALARTTVGKVLMSLVGDVKSAFAHMEEGFRVGRSCGTLAVQTIEERAIEVRFIGANPWIDCSDLGTLEGMGLFFGKTFRTEVELETDVDGSFICRWRD